MFAYCLPAQWQPAPHSEQLHPQEDFPCFLARYIERMMAATMPINAAEIRIVARLF